MSVCGARLKVFGDLDVVCTVQHVFESRELPRGESGFTIELSRAVSLCTAKNLDLNRFFAEHELDLDPLSLLATKDLKFLDRNMECFSTLGICQVVPNLRELVQSSLCRPDLFRTIRTIR